MTKAAEDLDWARLREEVARLEHERWARWQQFVHAHCMSGEEGTLIIPAELVQRWERQIGTPYETLSEAEKDSDRQQADIFLGLVRTFLKHQASG